MKTPEDDRTAIDLIRTLTSLSSDGGCACTISYQDDLSRHNQALDEMLGILDRTIRQRPAEGPEVKLAEELITTLANGHDVDLGRWPIRRGSVDSNVETTTAALAREFGVQHYNVIKLLPGGQGRYELIHGEPQVHGWPIYRLPPEVAVGVRLLLRRKLGIS